MENMMIPLFNMSITASFAAVFVMGFRLLLKKLPKSYSYVLWLVVLFRFLCPFTYHSDFSLLPVYSDAMGEEIIYEEVPTIESGVFFVDRPINRVLERAMAPEGRYISVNPLQIALFVMLVIWEAGMLVFFISHMAGYIRLRRRLGTAMKTSDRVYESDRITGAFVMGIFRPAIYLPCGLKQEERDMILLHERVHVKRRDYLVKAFGFLMVMVHWFNPLAYVSFHLMCSDMEMACDEKVLKELGEDGRKPYSLALLSAAEQRSRISFPLAFGESHTKLRIKNILSYKKPAFWVSAVVVILLGAAVFGLLTSPKQKAASISVIGGADGPTSIFIAGKNGENGGGNGVVETVRMAEMPASTWLAAQTLEETVVGDHAKNSIMLDFASDNQVIFHGAFGLFEFEREGDKWKLVTFMDGESSAELGAALEQIDSTDEADSHHMWNEEAMGATLMEYGVSRLHDGRTAVLGGIGDAAKSGRLIDVFYGIYDPETGVTQQVYLFAGDGAVIENRENRISERIYLFSQEDADYFLRTPEELLDFEVSGGHIMSTFYDRMELVRCTEGTTGVLDPLVSLMPMEARQILLADGRLIYWGGAESSMAAMKSPSLISLELAGLNRSVAELDYNVCYGLSYDAPYLYYEGWTNAGEFPRPIYRIKPDFEERVKIGEIDGSLITVNEGTFYILDREKPAIVVMRYDRFGEKMYLDKCGYDADHYRSIAASVEDGVLKMRLVDLENFEVSDYQTGAVDAEWWEERLGR